MLDAHSAIDVSTCIELVKGLQQCDSNVTAMNIRVLMASMKFQEEILKATWKTILSLLHANCSGLTDDEVLRLRATIMKVKWSMKLVDEIQNNHLNEVKTIIAQHPHSLR